MEQLGGQFWGGVGVLGQREEQGHGFLVPGAFVHFVGKSADPWGTVGGAFTGPSSSSADRTGQEEQVLGTGGPGLPGGGAADIFAARTGGRCCWHPVGRGRGWH